MDKKIKLKVQFPKVNDVCMNHSVKNLPMHSFLNNNSIIVFRYDIQVRKEVFNTLHAIQFVPLFARERRKKTNNAQKIEEQELQRVEITVCHQVIFVFAMSEKSKGDMSTILKSLLYFSVFLKLHSGIIFYSYSFIFQIIRASARDSDHSLTATCAELFDISKFFPLFFNIPETAFLYSIFIITFFQVLI